jgi:hypothetical protein
VNPVVLRAALELVRRAEARGKRGTTADAADLEALSHVTGDRIPAWHRELLAAVPLCGLELGWRASPPTEDEDGIARIGWSGVAEMRHESFQLHPGLAILGRGYLNVATDLDGDGAPYFIPVDGSDDLPVYRVYDEVTWGPDEILARGLVLVAPRLSGLFDSALLPGQGSARA